MILKKSIKNSKMTVLQDRQLQKNRKSYFWSLSEMMTITQNTIMECLFCLRLDFVFLSFVD